MKKWFNEEQIIAYRHGRRVSELVSLKWKPIDLARGRPQVQRVKNGTPATRFSENQKFEL